MKLFVRLAALLVAAVASIFTAQWTVRRFHHRNRSYYTFHLPKEEPED